jgi:hypothetical protein
MTFLLNLEYNVNLIDLTWNHGWNQIFLLLLIRIDLEIYWNPTLTFICSKVFYRSFFKWFFVCSKRFLILHFCFFINDTNLTKLKLPREYYRDITCLSITLSLKVYSLSSNGNTLNIIVLGIKLIHAKVVFLKSGILEQSETHSVSLST